MISTKECQELAAQVFAKIQREPSAHHQDAWALVLPENLLERGVGDEDGRTLVSCNTTGCVCGWASMLAGDRAVVEIGDDPEEFILPGDSEPTLMYSISIVQTLEGEDMAIENRGGQLLCLDGDDRGWLFSPRRTRLEVLYALRELAEGKPLSCLDGTDVRELIGDDAANNLMWPPPVVVKEPVELIDLEELLDKQKHEEKEIVKA